MDPFLSEKVNFCSIYDNLEAVTVRLLLLIAISCLLNWVIHLVDVSVSTWCGCCHLKPTCCKQTFLALGGPVPSASCSSSCFLIQTERDISFFLFFLFFVSPLFFFFPLLAICLFLSVQLTTLIWQPDNESQREKRQCTFSSVSFLRLLGECVPHVRRVCVCLIACCVCDSVTSWAGNGRMRLC